MSQQLHRDTYLSLRAVLHNVGFLKVKEREYGGLGASLGVHLWTWLAEERIMKLKSEGRWEGGIPNEPTLRRRVNYLADEDCLDEGIPRPSDEPPLWERTPFRILDGNPRKALDVVELQSGYRLRLANT